MLLITALLLWLADKAKNTKKPVSYSNSFVIGISQAIALLPGISRAGATISSSVLLGNDKSQAARFSFLMVVPLIIGKIAKTFKRGFGRKYHGNFCFGSRIYRRVYFRNCSLYLDDQTSAQQQTFVFCYLLFYCWGNCHNFWVFKLNPLLIIFI